MMLFSIAINFITVFSIINYKHIQYHDTILHFYCGKRELQIFHSIMIF